MAVLTVTKADGTEYEVGGTLDADALHDNVAAEIAAIAEKVTPVSADLLVIEDSVAGNAKSRVQVGNLPGSAGDVSAAANLTDNAILRGDDGTKGVQDSTATIADSGAMSVPGTIDTPELANTGGDLKIQPNVDGGVLLFSDTDVGDAVDGRSLYVYRRAAEGDRSIQLRVSSAMEAIISSNANFIIKTTSSKWILLSSTDDVVFGLGDNAGANKAIIKDLAGNEVAAIDSDGTGTFVTVDTPELANTFGDLKIEPDAEGNVTLFEDTDVADAAAGRSLFIHRKAVEGDNSLRLYVSNDREAVIDANADLVLISDVGKVLWLLSGDDVILGLGDDAGADKVEVQDVNLNVVGAWDSNGNITLDGTVDGRDVAADGTTLDGMEAFAIAMAVALG